MSKADTEDRHVKPFLEHIEDLRWTLIKSVAAVVVAMLGCLAFTRELIDVLKWPYDRVIGEIAEDASLYELHALKPSEAFMAGLKVTLAAGLVIALPYVIYQVWCFVSPGLSKRERRAALPGIAAGTFFFALGVVFCYFVVLKVCLMFFWKYSDYLGINQQWTIGYYLSFVVSMLLAFGVAFEMPVLTALLARFGLVSGSWLAAQRVYAILAIFVIAALVTPPDVISQLLLGIPMIGLYELSIIAAKAMEPGE